MDEETKELLRKLLSEIMVNSHRAFHLIPLKTNKNERETINQIMILCESIGDVLNINVTRELDEIISRAMERAIKTLKMEKK